MKMTMQYDQSNNQQQNKVTAPSNDVVPILHQKTGLLPIDNSVPLALRIHRANLKKQEIILSSQLSAEDSIKINSKLLYNKNQDLFNDNILTRILHPADSAKATILPVLKDTLASNSPDSTLYLEKVLAPITEVPTTSTSTSHLPEKSIAIQGVQTQMGWIVPTLMFLLLFAGTMKAYSGKYIQLLFKSIFNQQHSENLYQMVNVRKSLAAFAIDVLFILTFGLLALLSAARLGFGGNGMLSPLVYIVFCAALALAIILKTSVYRFIGYVFDVAEPTRKFIFFVFLYVRILGFVMLPIAATLAFVDNFLVLPLVVLGAILIIAMYLLQVAQGVKIFLQNRTALFYMFLYLCALEILPILVIYKFVMS